MITQLGRLHPERLGVIARTSAMQYKSTHKAADQIGRELGVGYLLEGSLRRAGDHVRVSAQLIQVRDQTHLWAESYERDLRDILALQSDVAQAIAWQIDVRLSPQQEARMARVRPIDPRVYELYSKGRYFWNKRSEEGYTRAIHYFEQAIARDPEYAQPYAGLADAYALLGSMPNVELPRSEAMPRARAAALKALALDEGLAEAHTSLAFVQMHFDWDWPAAEREFARALELNPGYATAHHWYAFWLIAQGRAEEALQEIRQAQRLDPLSLIINTDVGEMLYYGRRHDEAIDQARRALEMDSAFALAHRLLGFAYMAKRQFAPAIDELEAAARVSGGRLDGLAVLGVAYAEGGRRAEARKVLHHLEYASQHRPDIAHSIAVVLAGLGEEDQAFARLEQAYREHDGSLILLKVNPLFDPLRSDARFQDLMRRVSLVQR
jgi:tetratricopeptide (TPR) repeat protein